MRTLALALLFTATSLSVSRKRNLSSRPSTGTEQVQLLPNGDFQFQGTVMSGTYPNPAAWNRVGDAFANAGSNMVAVNLNVVAKGHLDGGAPVSGYNQRIILEPATDYVFSAYLWNLGEAAIT